MSRRRRLALLLPQFPYDPASGAARNLRSTAELLATAAGFDVACLATTATERGRSMSAATFLRACGIPASADGAVLRFESHGVTYEVLDVGDAATTAGWERDHGERFDAQWSSLLSSFRPDLVLTYGASPADRRRHRLAQARGAKVVFSLQNLAYSARGALDHVDAIVTCSQFVSDHYRRTVGLPSTPLPTPILPDEVIAPQREPLFVTFINPGLEKGLMFFATLAEELCRRRPDIPMLVVEGRGTSEDVIGAGVIGGFDLRRHANLMLAPPVAHPRDIFAATRVLLAPSVWDEPAGRVAVEALVNGVPPIVSDRGGLPEVCGGGGFVLPLPADLRMETPAPVAARDVREWLDLVVRLCDDEPFYASACARARHAGRAYLPDALLSRYAAFFASLVTGERAADQPDE